MRQLPPEEWCAQVRDHINRLHEDVQGMKHEQAVDKQVEALAQLNEKLMSNAVNYTNLIMVAGYAGFFAFWSTLVGKIPAWLFATCGLLITLSLILFISWELIKMFWSAKVMQQVQGILARNSTPSGVAQVLRVRGAFDAQSFKVWRGFLVATIATGMSAAVMLISFFCYQLVCTARVCT